VSAPGGRPLAQHLAVLSAVAVVMLLAAPTAIARKLQMSGTWAMRRGRVFVPIQFAMTKDGTQTTMT